MNSKSFLSFLMVLGALFWSACTDRSVPLGSDEKTKDVPQVRLGVKLQNKQSGRTLMSGKVWVEGKENAISSLDSIAWYEVASDNIYNVVGWSSGFEYESKLAPVRGSDVLYQLFLGQAPKPQPRPGSLLIKAKEGVVSAHASYTFDLEADFDQGDTTVKTVEWTGVTSSNGLTATWTANTRGNYNHQVTCKVTDHNNLTVKDDIFLTITDPGDPAPIPLVADLVPTNGVLSVNPGGTIPLKTLAFNGTRPYRYQFIFPTQDVVGTAVDSTASVTLQKPGSYRVTVIVTDAKNVQFVTSLDVQAKDPQRAQRPLVMIKEVSGVLSATAPHMFNFSATITAERPITNYEWTGASGSSSQASLMVTQKGTYVVQVTLKVTQDDGQEGFDDLFVVVYEPLPVDPIPTVRAWATPVVIYEPTRTVRVGAQGYLGGDSTAGGDYQWVGQHGVSYSSSVDRLTAATLSDGPGLYLLPVLYVVSGKTARGYAQVELRADTTVCRQNGTMWTTPEVVLGDGKFILHWRTNVHHTTLMMYKLGGAGNPISVSHVRPAIMDPAGFGFEIKEIGSVTFYLILYDAAGNTCRRIRLDVLYDP